MAETIAHLASTDRLVQIQFSFIKPNLHLTLALLLLRPKILRKFKKLRWMGQYYKMLEELIWVNFSNNTASQRGQPKIRSSLTSKTFFNRYCCIKIEIKLKIRVKTNQERRRESLEVVIKAASAGQTILHWYQGAKLASKCSVRIDLRLRASVRCPQQLIRNRGCTVKASIEQRGHRRLGSLEAVWISNK